MPGTAGMQFGPPGVKNDDHHSLAVILAVGLAVLAATMLIVAISTLSGGGDSGPARAIVGELRLGPVYYTVRSGDTYIAISKRTGLSVDALETLNPRVDPSALAVGQRIRLRKVAKRKPKPSGPVAVTVKRGESFSSIATRRGKTVAQLRSLNPDLKPSSLQPGDRMRLR